MFSTCLQVMRACLRFRLMTERLLSLWKNTHPKQWNCFTLHSVLVSYAVNREHMAHNTHTSDVNIVVRLLDWHPLTYHCAPVGRGANDAPSHLYPRALTVWEAFTPYDHLIVGVTIPNVPQEVDGCVALPFLLPLCVTWYQVLVCCLPPHSSHAHWCRWRRIDYGSQR